MRTWTRSALALVVSGAVLSSARAQIPVPPPGAALVAPAPAPVAPTNNLWSFFCPTPAQKLAWKECFCSGPFGQIANAAGKPVMMMSGGLFGNCCPTNIPTAAALAMPADSAVGAAALVMQDEAGAKARRLAIRYLGTVDCRYWPEAEAALINGLRADKNECVRWEAAMALQRGCCCSPKIIEALSISVSGSDRDGQPAECSERVREAAAGALQMCLSGYPETEPVFAPVAPTPPPPVLVPEEVKPATPKELPPGGQAELKDYYKRLTAQQQARIINDARRALELHYRRPYHQATPASAPGEVRPGANGVFGIISQAVGTEPLFPTVAAAPQTASVQAESERSGLVYMAYSWLRSGPTESAAPVGPAAPPRPPSTAVAAGDHDGLLYVALNWLRGSGSGGGSPYTANDTARARPIGSGSGLAAWTPAAPVAPAGYGGAARPNYTIGTIEWDR
jgi:hypothetical protein